MQQDFEDNVLRKEEEERQQKLKMLRSQKQPVSRSEIRLHQQKYDQILGQKKARLRNLREGVGLTERETYESEERVNDESFNAKKLHQSKMLAAIKKKDRQLRLKGEIVMEEKKKLKERKQNYAMYVKEMYMPKARRREAGTAINGEEKTPEGTPRMPRAAANASVDDFRGHGSRNQGKLPPLRGVASSQNHAQLKVNSSLTKIGQGEQRAAPTAAKPKARKPPIAPPTQPVSVQASAENPILKAINEPEPDLAPRLPAPLNTAVPPESKDAIQRQTFGNVSSSLQPDEGNPVLHGFNLEQQLLENDQNIEDIRAKLALLDEL